MLPVALDLLRGVFQLAEIAAIAFGVTFAVACVWGEPQRVLLRRRARKAVKAYGLSLVPRDEVADRRARRGGGRAA